MGDADPGSIAESREPRAEVEAQLDLLARLGRAAPDSAGWPVDLTGAPLIVDTDLGSDADDAVALAVAARCCDELALVSTGDETGPRAGGYGQRARATRWLLDACGRPEVPVVAGASLGDIDHFVLAGAIPERIGPAREGEVVAAVAELAERTTGRLRWIGIAPMTNLARVVRERPDIAARLQVTQMGAAIDYRHPDRAEHNVRLDLDAARTVIDAARDGPLAGLELVISDVTFTEDIALTPTHPIVAALQAEPAEWARMLEVSLHRWFAHPRGHPHTMQHDALALSAALELPFVDSAPAAVALDEIGRLIPTSSTAGSPTGGGGPVMVARRADYPAFMAWLARGLGLTHSTTRASAPRAARASPAVPGVPAAAGQRIAGSEG